MVSTCARSAMISVEVLVPLTISIHFTPFHSNKERHLGHPPNPLPVPPSPSASPGSAASHSSCCRHHPCRCRRTRRERKTRTRVGGLEFWALVSMGMYVYIYIFTNTLHGYADGMVPKGRLLSFTNMGWTPLPCNVTSPLLVIQWTMRIDIDPWTIFWIPTQWFWGSMFCMRSITN